MKEVTYDQYTWNDIALSILLERKQYLEDLIKNKTVSISEAPEGHLRAIDRGNYYQYFRRVDPKDSTGEYLTKEKRELARQLAQKDYDRDAINEAQRELALVTGYVEHLKKRSLIHIYDRLKPARKRLVNPIYVDDEQYIREWRSKEYETLDFYEMKNNFYSENGVRVRSKSELIIANMLEKNRIPYRYEYPLRLKGQVIVRPDFLCLNVRMRKEYIWEHFGMMDNPSYANRNVEKITKYEQNGYSIGENMIMTFETTQCAINPINIKRIINQYLL